MLLQLGLLRSKQLIRMSINALIYKGIRLQNDFISFYQKAFIDLLNIKQYNGIKEFKFDTNLPNVAI